MSNIVKVSLKANGKHYLEIVDNKRKKNRWYTFTGKRYDLPIQGLAEGSYFVRAYNDELNEICEHRIMVSYYLVVK